MRTGSDPARGSTPPDGTKRSSLPVSSIKMAEPGVSPSAGFFPFSAWRSCLAGDDFDDAYRRAHTKANLGSGAPLEPNTGRHVHCVVVDDPETPSGK